MGSGLTGSGWDGTLRANPHPGQKHPQRFHKKDLQERLSPTEVRIIDAARACFETNGIAQTRLEEIASSAGLSRQTIYKYINGKQEIIDRIGFLEIVKINSILRTTLRSDEDFAERLTNAIVISAEKRSAASVNTPFPFASTPCA